QAGAHLLHGLVARERAERGDPLLGVDELPQLLGAAPGEGVLLADGSAQRHDVLGGVVAPEAGPARVARPAGGDLDGGLGLVAGAARGAGGRTRDARPRRDGAERTGAARVLGRGAAADDGGPGHGCLLVVRRPAACGPAGPVGGPRRGPCFDLPPRVKPFSSAIERKNRRSSVRWQQLHVSCRVLVYPTSRPSVHT